MAFFKNFAQELTKTVSAFSPGFLEDITNMGTFLTA
jgi:hypothetical protein